MHPPSSGLWTLFSFVNTKSSVRLLSDYLTLIFTEYFQQSLSFSAFSSDIPYLVIISSHYSPQLCFFFISSVPVTFVVLTPLSADSLYVNFCQPLLDNKLQKRTCNRKTLSLCLTFQSPVPHTQRWSKNFELLKALLWITSSVLPNSISSEKG